MTSPKPAESVRVRARVSTSSEWWRDYRPSAAMLAERVRQLEAELEALRSGASVSAPAASEPRARDRVSRKTWPLRPQWWAGYSPSTTQLFDLIGDLEAEIERLRSGKTEGKQGGPEKMGIFAAASLGADRGSRARACEHLI